MRVLIVSWEYPPIVEGGLARHVRKLSEQLVRDGVEVHVLTRGGGRLGAREERHGVVVHRVREPEFPRDARELSSWLSPADCARLVLACLTSPELGFAIVYGVSANQRSWWAAAPGRRLGYEPQDDAEAFAAGLTGDVDGPQGADFAARERHGSR